MSINVDHLEPGVPIAINGQSQQGFRIDRQDQNSACEATQPMHFNCDRCFIAIHVISFVKQPIRLHVHVVGLKHDYQDSFLVTARDILDSVE